MAGSVRGVKKEKDMSIVGTLNGLETKDMLRRVILKGSRTYKYRIIKTQNSNHSAFQCTSSK